MYYHIRLDKIKHDACTDMDARRVWDFRSLHAALEMIKREFGAMAQSWSICDLTEQTEDIFKLEPILEKALPSVYQYLVMLFKEGESAAEKYNHYEFFVSLRDENERPPSERIIE